ncbi:peptidylprolyl isomerase [Sandaracinobacteroides hominis]|uniref:peptidylprolyl isomerase n=1 Tax=Sandaracinobacteroides hominis TaxID=2780086 RepID=UPI0018F75D6A|nr:peptidylprolyl isomerase [Sandaracinobacteroides hominis]
MIRALIAAAALVVALPALAQEAPAAPPAPAPVAPAATAPKPATVKVKLTTAEGPIVLELEKERAPITTANFLKYVDSKKLDGVTFYRAMNFPGRPDLGLIQGGVKSDPKRVFPPIAHEPTSKTGLTHDNGAISMARAGVGTANADFFIIVGGLPGLDAQPGGDPGYAVFGHVVEGMDVVMKILAAPTSATEGVGVMKGQMIAKPIPITTARRTD